MKTNSRIESKQTCPVDTGVQFIIKVDNLAAVARIPDRCSTTHVLTRIYAFVGMWATFFT